MKCFTSAVLFLLVACRVAAADIPISYDKLLEGQTATYEVVDTVIEELNVEAKFKDKGLGSIEERALLTPRDALFSLEKRQYCNPGYGYCDSKSKPPLRPPAFCGC
jgi:hypothetical protein